MSYKYDQLTCYKSFMSGSTFSEELNKAVKSFAKTSDRDAMGAIYTRREVVDFILDLVGYDPDDKLYELKILEPSFGEGDFLIPMVDRLLRSWKKHNSKQNNALEFLSDSLRAVELHTDTYVSIKNILISKLSCEGIPQNETIQIVDKWLINGDYLLETLIIDFDIIVGNPPYIRQEAIPEKLLNEYRNRYKTIYDRADIYVAFYERALSMLKYEGKLCYICSDRWMKNRYGGPLRNYISSGFNLNIYIDMYGTDAFHTDVSAYTAITVISRQKQGGVKVVHRPKLDKKTLNTLFCELTSTTPLGDKHVKEINGIVNSSEPWLMEYTDQISILRRIEEHFPLIEEVGCKVGIGVATGADRVYIQDYYQVDVEEDRILKLVTPKDIISGQIVWKGKGVINPFTDTGELVNLDLYPRLKRFLDNNSELIKKRHVAIKNPANWYRTIDRIWPELIHKPKLLIPDIKGEAHIVYDSGNYYPQHNLYYMISDTWDLRALQAVLLSNIVNLFIASYSTKIRGGYFRFQAQYLRRIRIPQWQKIPVKTRNELISAAESRDIEKCNEVACKLYGLSHEEISSLKGYCVNGY